MSPECYPKTHTSSMLKYLPPQCYCCSVTALVKHRTVGRYGVAVVCSFITIVYCAVAAHKKIQDTHDILKQDRKKYIKICLFTNFHISVAFSTVISCFMFLSHVDVDDEDDSQWITRHVLNASYNITNTLANLQNVNRMTQCHQIDIAASLCYRYCD